MSIEAPKKSWLVHMEILAKLMDSQFKIPGTSIRFGWDALIGVVPGIGDFATFLVSGYMVTVLAKNGASGFLLARMVWNIVLDALVGSIPVLGDMFDVAFKANQRNLQLMREHYHEGRHRGSAWKLIIPILLFMLLLIGCIVWLTYRAIALLIR